jgi:cytochrome c oxidase subunit 2
VFLVLGTLVGVVVLAYMAHKAYKYRAGGPRADEGAGDRPRLGELPAGGGGGRKLFLSFGLSAVVVLSLVSWTYLSLLYVEGGPPDDALDVEVEGYQWGWSFVYPNGHTDDVLRVPANRSVRLHVTSRDVFHNFGIPELRVKADAIPGRNTTTWFVAEEPGTYEAQCYELCGAGHSYMTADVIVMDPAAYESWYAGTGDGSATGASTGEGAASNGTVSTGNATGTNGTVSTAADPAPTPGAVAATVAPRDDPPTDRDRERTAPGYTLGGTT